MLTRRTLLITLPVLAALAGCTDDPMPATPDAAAALATVDAPDEAAGEAALGVDEFAAVIDEPGTVILDVRTPQEYAEGHLEGAQNLDVSAPDFAQALDGLDPGASYAVYCRTGVRSAAALDIMREQGFDSLVHLEGGISAWTASGRPVAN